MGKELISICVPSWNCGEYLGKLVESVQNQLGVRWEMIIVDVGSSDGTERVIKSIADKKIKHIRADRQYNANVARNIGLCVAQGEYIFIADADSKLSPDCLAKLETKLVQGYDFAYCDFGVVWEIGKYEKRGVHICGEWDEERIAESNYISIMSMWKRDKMPVLDKKLERMQDWDLHLGALQEKLRAGYVREKLFTVWMREGGMSRKIDKEIWEDVIKDKRGI